MTFQCRYKSMGLKECVETPGLYTCQPCRELAAFERQETSYLKIVERDVLNNVAVPHYVLTGMSVPTSALEAEENRQRRDDHVDALRYALASRKCGKYAEAMDGGCDKPSGHEGYCSGPVRMVYDFPCSCGRTIRGTDRDRGKRCAHEQPKPPTLRECRYQQCDGSGLMASGDRNGRDVCDCRLIPPTLREWLGPRGAELGRWAEVLREQPVPAGMIVAWHWDHSGPEWLLIASDRDDRPGCGTYVSQDFAGVFDRCDDNTDITCWMESLQMSLFTRHPDVQPEPKLRTWFGNEEES